MGVDSGECNIKVICRVRPLNQSEERAGSKYVLKFLSDEALSIGNKNFTYDKVFRPDVTQEDLYTKVAKPIVKDVLSGYNGTIFAYGQTASGKTHTMEGQLDNSELEGIIPRIVGDIFGHIYEIDNDQIEFHIKVSYFEIYMDKIRDLLDVNKTNLIVHEDKNRVPYVKGATEHFVSCPKDVMQVVAQGKSNRHVAVTNMNEHSSRSHSVFLINVKQVNNETDKKLSGKLYLVDLAGSEKVSKTGAEGSVLDEAKNINKSLSALGNVIAALADNSSFVPYRDSKLTRILQESLGGNAQTTMIICCSPASFNETETKSTLMFGSRFVHPCVFVSSTRAKTIKNKVTLNEELTAEEWKRRYEKEKDRSNKMRLVIQRCEAELDRWRAGETVPEEDRLMVKDTADSSLSSQTALDSLLKKVGTDKSSSEVEAERIRWDEEKNQLYQQIDDKDEELNNTLEILEKHKEQLLDTEEQIKAYIRDRDLSTAEIARLESEKESSKSEIKELFSALSELAQNFDLKVSECNGRKEELDAVTDEQEKKKECMDLLEMEVLQLNEAVSIGRSRIIQFNTSVFTHLAELGRTLNSETKVDIPIFLDKLEDETGILRLVFTKLITEVRILVENNSQLSEDLVKLRERCEELERELASSRLQTNQLEVKVKSVTESLRETEGNRQTLEQQFDSLDEQCSQLKTKEQMYMVQLGELEKKEHEVASTTQMKQALEKQMQLHTEQHSKQIADLRNQLTIKDKKISDVTNSSEDLNVVLETLRLEHSYLLEAEASKAAQLSEVSARLERTEQSRKDLRQLEDVVSKEMQMLQNLRKHFIRDVTERVKKTQTGSPDDEDSFTDARTQRQKIIFLENNLDQLTKVHKQVVKDNTELRGELPKLQKRLKITMERIRALENALKEAKEGSLRDRKRYQQEVDRIKEVVRQKNLLRKGHSATIVKPIRAGQAPTSAGSPVVARPAT